MENNFQSDSQDKGDGCRGDRSYWDVTARKHGITDGRKIFFGSP